MTEPEEKTSPHSLEAEKAVLGSVIISPKGIRPLLDVISGDDFFRHAHRLVWAAILDCHSQEQQTDFVSVRAKLELRGDMEAVGGPVYLASLTDGVPRSTDADHYARVVVEHADRRRLQAVCRDGINEFGGATNPAESANGLVDQIRGAVRGSRSQGVMLKDSIRDLMAELDAPPKVTNTGFKSLDKLGCGFRPGELTLLSGRPSSGKTALALHLAQVVAEGVALHPQTREDGLEALRCLGGRELAAMAGAILRARHLRIPVLLDGVICAEAGHAPLLAHLGKEPLLSLGLRLGEGSGAALAIGIVKGAVACQSGMMTFAEAGVADG